MGAGTESMGPVTQSSLRMQGTLLTPKVRRPVSREYEDSATASDVVWGSVCNLGEGCCRVLLAWVCGSGRPGGARPWAVLLRIAKLELGSNSRSSVKAVYLDRLRLVLSCGCERVTLQRCWVRAGACPRRPEL